MTDIATQLAEFPTPQGFPEGGFAPSAHLWTPFHLAAGDRLWQQGDGSDGLALVLRGGVTAEADGVELATIGVGGILGEVSAFVAGATRSATIAAPGGAELALIPTVGLELLRVEHRAIYDALLSHSLRAIVRRVRAVDQRITALAAGDVPVPVRSEPGVLTRLWRKLVPGLPDHECPPLAPLLRRQQALDSASRAVVATIASPFVAEALPEGHILYLEGDPGDSACVIASGGVDVLRVVKGERAERVASLWPGDLLGINALVEHDTRTASCVTSAPTWIWKISVEATESLRGDAGIRWKETMLASLSMQIVHANSLLARVSGNDPDIDAQAADLLLRAQGYLEGLPAPSPTS